MEKSLAIMVVLLLAFGCVSDNSAIYQNQNSKNSPVNSTKGDNGNFSGNFTQNITQDQTNATNSSEYDFSRTYSDSGKLIVYSFYSAGCSACKAIAPYVESIGMKYESQTEWRGFNIDRKDDRAVYQQFYKKMNLTQDRAGVPVMMVNNTILWGRYEINDSLGQLINSSLPR